MARGVNKVILLGNVGRDPEIRYSQGGTAVGTFSLATAERAKVGGEWQDKTEWHNILTFGKTAENCGQFLKKGNQAYVEGRIQTRKYDKDGQTHYRTEIVANDVVFLSAKTGTGQGAGAAPRDVGTRSGFETSHSPTEPFPDAGLEEVGFDPNDDVPF
jgi:single-strand DNA-binding protein